MGALPRPTLRPVPASTAGRIETVSAEGRIRVRHAHHPEPVEAMTLVALDLDARLEGLRVLLAFLDDDPTRPVLLGPLGEGALDPNLGAARRASLAETVLVRDLELSASNSVSIRCGRSRLLMDRFGKIVVKGRDVLTRAAERNRLKGGSISLN